VALSALMTPVIRGAAPVVPAHFIDAPAAGTGKSYLIDLASALAVGDRAAVLAFSPDSSETEKRLVGAALEGRPMIALDNCTGVIAGDFLCQVTERPLMTLRPLGTSDTKRVGNAFSVFINGNNAVVAADMVRRTLKCSMDADTEHPETRTFKRNPLAAILADRGKYIAAVLTVCRAYICAGYPGKQAPLASFEAWSDLVRSALVWLERPDPASTIAALRESDPVREARANVFEAWIASARQRAVVPGQRNHQCGRVAVLHRRAREAACRLARCRGRLQRSHRDQPEALGQVAGEDAGEHLWRMEALRRSQRYNPNPVAIKIGGEGFSLPPLLSPGCFAGFARFV
jgi:hypothetical protein